MKLLISFLVACFVSVSPTDCKLKRDEDGIKVYTCKSEGVKLKSLRAEFVLKNVTIDELEKFVMDVKGYTKWQYNMIESAVIKKISDHEMIYRTEVKAPWPVENRELLVHFTSSRNPENGTMDIVIANEPMDYPAKEGVVRVPDSYGTWHIETQGKDLKIVYALRIDPGGSVPVWLVNIAMADGPHHSFRNLKRAIEH